MICNIICAPGLYFTTRLLQSLHNPSPISHLQWPILGRPPSFWWNLALESLYCGQIATASIWWPEVSGRDCKMLHLFHFLQSLEDVRKFGRLVCNSWLPRDTLGHWNFFAAGLWREKMQVKRKLVTGQSWPIIFINFLGVPPGNQPLTKETEDYRYYWTFWVKPAPQKFSVGTFLFAPGTW